MRNTPGRESEGGRRVEVETLGAAKCRLLLVLVVVVEATRAHQQNVLEARGALLVAPVTVAPQLERRGRDQEREVVGLEGDDVRIADDQRLQLVGDVVVVRVVVRRVRVDEAVEVVAVAVALGVAVEVVVDEQPVDPVVVGERQGSEDESDGQHEGRHDDDQGTVGTQGTPRWWFGKVKSRRSRPYILAQKRPFVNAICALFG